MARRPRPEPSFVRNVKHSEDITVNNESQDEHTIVLDLEIKHERDMLSIRHQRDPVTDM